MIYFYFIKRVIKILLQLIFAMIFLKCSNPPTTIIIGHRGAMGHILENTLPSIQKAMELGVDGIEVDIFKCNSGELVVFHDQSLKRLSGNVSYIENLQLDSIRKINLEGNHKIPTLIEVLDLINGKVLLNIELKGTQTAKETNELINFYLNNDENWTTEKFIISSFNWNELNEFYNLNKQVPIAVLTDGDPLDAIPIAKQLNAKAINPKYESLNENNVKKIHSSGYKIYPYTINSKNDIIKMVNLKVDGIITDYPERVNNVIKSF